MDAAKAWTSAQNGVVQLDCLFIALPHELDDIRRRSKGGIAYESRKLTF